MGKVKSAIITAFLVAAIVVLAGFATISCNVSGGVKRYNSFVSSIRMGSEFTGAAYTVLYPEGVISASEYELGKPDEDEEDYETELAKYEAKYEAHSGGRLYIEKEKIGYEYDEEKDEYKLIDETAEQQFAESVLSDVDVLTKRFGEKGYSGYSVNVIDGYAIKVTVPANFTYSAYRGYDTASRSAALSEISYSVSYLTLSGELGLRDANTFDDSKSVISIIRYDFKNFFKGASLYSMGGNNAVKIRLTNEGFSKINTALKDYSGSAESAYFYIGETCLGLTATLKEELSDKTLFFSPDGFSKSNVQDIAILLNSAIFGDTLVNEYVHDGLVPVTAGFGEYSAIYLFVAMLLIIVAAIVLSVLKYKKLGLVHAIIVLIYSLVIVCALMLLEIQLTLAGAFTVLLGLALLTFTNFRVFEAVRKETLSGRTVQASVKTGYKKTLATVLDLHIVLVVVSIMLALIGVGEIAACGFIFFIASLASYILYWFTRFMWYVISSPVRDKFKFCGFAREELDDED